MRRKAPDHPKMERLASLMKVPKRYAIAWANGVMERLWHYTASYAIQGDIGKLSDEQIAIACGWPKVDGQALVEALVEARWLDRDASHRLIVHDWHEHADDSVKKTLKHRGLQFIFPARPTDPAGNVPASFPSLTKPVPTIPQPERHTETPSEPRTQLSQPVNLDGMDACDWFRENYPAEVPENLWQDFPRYVNTPERVEALLQNGPLWIATRKYREGYAPKALKFLSDGIFMKPPPPALTSNGAKREDVEIIGGLGERRKISRAS